jgi:hypothetical protein
MEEPSYLVAFRFGGPSVPFGTARRVTFTGSTHVRIASASFDTAADRAALAADLSSTGWTTEEVASAEAMHARAGELYIALVVEASKDGPVSIDLDEVLPALPVDGARLRRLDSLARGERFLSRHGRVATVSKLGTGSYISTVDPDGEETLMAVLRGEVVPVLPAA